MTDRSAPQLFDPEPGERGRVRRAIDAQIELLDAEFRAARPALVAIVRDLADASDVAHIRRDPFATVAADRELREALDKLMPDIGGDSFEAAVKELNAIAGTSLGHPTQS